MRQAHGDEFPGTLQLHGPFAQYILLLDKECPVAFINDVRGSEAQPNIVIEQREKLALLGHTDPWHTLFHVRSVRDIAADEELVVLSTLLYSDYYVCFAHSGPTGKDSGMMKEEKNKSPRKMKLPKTQRMSR